MFSAPASRRNCRIASRNGSDSMSPTVPPISVTTTSQSLVSAALLADHPLPDRAGCVVRVSREVLVDEALVVADVEIGLGAVLGHEYLTVLERAHRARVDVDVRVELLHLDLEAARLQQPAQRSGGDALAEGRDDAAGDEDVLRRTGGYGCLPSASISRSTGVRSIDSPSERVSPRRVRPARAPIAAQRPFSVSLLTELKPSIAPSAFAPESPSIAISRRS